MITQRVSEPKLSKCGTFSIRKVKLGNRLRGQIETLKVKPGYKSESVFWAAEDIVFVSIRDASLYVVPSAVNGLRNYGVSKIGVRASNGISYITSLEALKTCTLTSVSTSGTFKARLQVPLSLWEEVLPDDEDHVSIMLGKMRIPGRGGKSAVSVALE